jgi:hypothetical protein
MTRFFGAAIAVCFALPAFAQKQIIEVRDVEDLYRVVNNLNNTNTVVRLLSQGSPYKLTPNVPTASDPDGTDPASTQPRLKRGRLVLLSKMDLIGEGSEDEESEDGQKVVIDATRLLLTDHDSFGDLINLGVIEASVDEHSIRNLHVIGSATEEAEISIHQVGGPVGDGSGFLYFVEGTIDVTVSHCTLESGGRGIEMTTSLTDSAQMNLVADHNVIRNHIVPGTLWGWGIQIWPIISLNANMTARIEHNHIYGNKNGLFLANLGAFFSTKTVYSTSNVYEDQVWPIIDPTNSIGGAGIYIANYDVNTPFGPLGSVESTTQLVSTDDAIWNNEGYGGLRVEGINRSFTGTVMARHKVDVQLSGTRFVKYDGDRFDGPQNFDTSGPGPAVRRDIALVALFTNPVGNPSGIASGNSVNLVVDDAQSSLCPTSYDPTPKAENLLDVIANSPDVTITVDGALDFQGERSCPP